MTPLPRTVALAVAALAFAACGKSVVPATRYETPIAELTATVTPGGALASFRNPRVGILWTDPLERQTDVPMPATYLGSTRTSRYPDADTFSIALYRPPPPGAMVEIDDGHEGGQSAVLALGELVLFDDAKDDGRFAAPDTLFLGGSDSVVAYVARPFTGATAGSFPLAGLDMTGYALLRIRCGGDDSRILMGVDKVLSRALDFVFQQSNKFPEVRPCLRTHSP